MIKWILVAVSLTYSSTSSEEDDNNSSFSLARNRDDGEIRNYSTEQVFERCNNGLIRVEKRGTKKKSKKGKSKKDKNKKDKKKKNKSKNKNKDKKGKKGKKDKKKKSSGSTSDYDSMGTIVDIDDVASVWGVPSFNNHRPATQKANPCPRSAFSITNGQVINIGLQIAVGSEIMIACFTGFKLVGDTVTCKDGTEASGDLPMCVEEVREVHFQEEYYQENPGTGIEIEERKTYLQCYKCPVGAEVPQHCSSPGDDCDGECATYTIIRTAGMTGEVTTSVIRDCIPSKQTTLTDYSLCKMQNIKLCGIAISQCRCELHRCSEDLCNDFRARGEIMGKPQTSVISLVAQEEPQIEETQMGQSYNQGLKCYDCNFGASSEAHCESLEYECIGGSCTTISMIYWKDYQLVKTAMRKCIPSKLDKEMICRIQKMKLCKNNPPDSCSCDIKRCSTHQCNNFDADEESNEGRQSYDP